MTDLLLDTNGDLLLQNGMMVRGKSNQQHQTLLLLTSPGEWKENLTTGVDAQNYLENEDVSGLLNAIRQQFIKDGQTLTTVQVNAQGKIVTDADYTN